MQITRQPMRHRTAEGDLTYEKRHPVRGVSLTSNVTLGSLKSEPRGRVRSSMSFRGKRELLVQLAPAMAVLGSGSGRPFWTSSMRPLATNGSTRSACCSARSVHQRRSDGRVRLTNGPGVQGGAECGWSAANAICAKRMVPFLPELIPTLERHGYLDVSRMRDAHNCWPSVQRRWTGCCSRCGSLAG